MDTGSTIVKNIQSEALFDNVKAAQYAEDIDFILRSRENKAAAAERARIVGILEALRDVCSSRVGISALDTAIKAISEIEAAPTSAIAILNS